MRRASRIVMSVDRDDDVFDEIRDYGNIQISSGNISELKRVIDHPININRKLMTTN